jgi:hypothetical protein
MTDTRIDALADEVAAADFRDPRLSRRLGSLVQAMAMDPERSFPKALSSAQLEGAYRFFSNPVVNPEGILSGHFHATRARCLEESVTLVVHDSSKFAFRPDGQRQGLGRLKTSGQGFFAHAALALRADETRHPLGVAGLMTWIRSDEDDKRVENERDRWPDLVDVTARRLEGAALVHVMDREADDYGLFAHLLAGQHRFVIRSMHNRLLMAPGPGAPRKLDEAVAQIERTVERQAPLTKRVDGNRSPVQKRIHPARSPRIATLAVGAAHVTLQRPTTQPSSRPACLSLHVVRVWEPAPPPDEPAVEWTLLTTEPIETAADLVGIVDWYRARWTIEEYFKALKTGCAYEQRQLGDYESLVNALALFAPIACRMLALRSEARRNPEAPATAALVSKVELDVLRALGRRPLPLAPTTRQVLLAIAALGGHIKYSGDPGWLTLARGHSEMLTLTRAWIAARLPPECDQR